MAVSKSTGGIHSRSNQEENGNLSSGTTGGLQTEAHDAEKPTMLTNESATPERTITGLRVSSLRDKKLKSSAFADPSVDPPQWFIVFTSLMSTVRAQTTVVSDKEITLLGGVVGCYKTWED